MAKGVLCLIFGKNKIPTDRKILEFIYKAYFREFCDFDKSNPSRRTKIYLPVDISKIASHFNVDNDLIFGRLLYHLEQKYGYKQRDGNDVYFFALELGKETKCINFPYMVSILSDMQDQQKKFGWTVKISALALIISSCSLLLSGYKTYLPEKSLTPDLSCELPCNKPFKQDK
jgi:hypothetical protein